MAPTKPFGTLLSPQIMALREPGVIPSRRTERTGRCSFHPLVVAGNTLSNDRPLHAAKNKSAVVLEGDRTDRMFDDLNRDEGERLITPVRSRVFSPRNQSEVSAGRTKSGAILVINNYDRQTRGLWVDHAIGQPS